MDIIDAHCHVGAGRDVQLAPEDLLTAMDRNGVNRACLCAMDRCLAVYNREGNDALIGLTRRFPDRFVGFASVNPWYGDRAVEELRRAVGEGLRGLKLHPILQGFQLNDEMVYPLMEMAMKLGLPVYMHTGTLVHSGAFQLGDLAEAFPEVPFLMGHMATTDYWYDVIPSSARLPNVYFETSLKDPGFIQTVLSEVGPERVIFGSNVPTSDYELEIESVRWACPDPADREKVFGANILKLLER